MMIAPGLTMPIHAMGIAISLLAGQLAPRALPQDPCAASDECIENGRCTSVDGDCVATREDDCRWSERCHASGFCSVVEGECLAGSDHDCKRSSACTQANRCYLDPEEHVCDDGTEDADRPVLIGGIVLSAVGGGAVVIGGLLIAMQMALSTMGDDEEPAESETPVLGLTVMGGGALLALGAGMPMAIVGGRDVPRDRVSAAPTVIVAPTGASLHWSF